MNTLAHSAIPPHALATQRRRRVALGTSCMLHLLLAVVLLWKISTPARLGLQARQAPITLDLLPFTKPAAAAAHNPAASTARPAPKPKPHTAPHTRAAAPPSDSGPAPQAAPAPDHAEAATAPAPPTPTAQTADAMPSSNAVASAVAAASTEARSAGATGADRSEPLPIEYLREVSRMIRVNLNYPWQARRDRIEGTAVVHILLARDGSVVSVSLLQGASNSALDEEACNVVLRIRKFPGLPDEVLRGGREFAIDQPIRFHRA